MHRSRDANLVLTNGTTFFGNRDLPLAGEEPAGLTSLGLLHRRERTFGNDFAAQFSWTGSEVDDVIGGSHGLFIVFDNNDRIPLIAEIAQALQQHGVVARMQPDAGFVEDVNDTGQPTPNLTREPNALALSTRQRRRGSIKSEIIESTLQQEA